MPNVFVPDEVIASLQRSAKRLWQDDPEADESSYMSSVTQGNADDTFADGVAQGEAAMATDLLAMWGIQE